MSDHDPAKQYDTADGKTRLQSDLSDAGTSALRKYQDINVGSRSLFALARYEFYTMLLAPLPGALGFVLRKFFARWLFGAVGSGVVIGRSVTVRHPARIFLGNGVMIDDYAVLDAKGSGSSAIELADNVLIGRAVVLSCKDGRLTIGERSNLALGCFVQSARTVRIGDKVLFGAYCYVIGGGDHRVERTDIPIMDQGQTIEGIEIGDNSWLGADVKVTDGVKIGRDCILGAGAVVNQDVPDFHIAAGVPARVIRDRRQPDKD